MSQRLPKYKCHKEVRAAQIQHVEFLENSDAIRLVFGELGNVDVGGAFVHKHNPVVGSYYVLYEDGYESISPEKAFEEGYTLVDERQVKITNTQTGEEKEVNMSEREEIIEALSTPDRKISFNL